ncbi:hypothetical protein CR513_16090, partial [Mucuna pruriens]
MSNSCNTLEHPKSSKNEWRTMPSTTFGMILTYKGYALTRSHAGAFRNPKSSRSSTSITSRTKEATMDRCEWPRESLTMGYTGPPSLETRIDLSQPTNSAKEPKWL